AEQVESRGMVVEPVERRLDVGLELRERGHRSPLRGRAVLGGEIELGAIARRQTGRLPAVLREPRGEGPRLLLLERDALAQLDGGVVVRRADEDEADHAKWLPGSASRTTTTRTKPASATYAARRPAQPAARRRTRYALQTSHVATVAAMSASKRSPLVTRRASPTAIPSVRSGTDHATVRSASSSSVASAGTCRRRIAAGLVFSLRSCQT